MSSISIDVYRYRNSAKLTIKGVAIQVTVIIIVKKLLIQP